ncbi:MAG TPA: NADH-quinone oxidoreductase subunit C [Nitriliruptorales bacterium]|nr:NADH-quinone oxidoreductase subunit C [Nitriliruptorales bacterium]
MSEPATTTTGRLDPEELERRVQARFPDLAANIAYGELTVFVPPERLLDVLAFCRDDDALLFDLLSDVSGVHWPGGEHVVEPQLSTTGWPPNRLTRDRGTVEVAYHLASLVNDHRLRLVVAVDDDPDGPPTVPSATGLFPTADFHEREVYDFFGVHFEGHPNLVRILMPDEWIGHPGRKDYPLGGVDTEYHGAFIPPPDERVWSRDVPGAGGGKVGP